MKRLKKLGIVGLAVLMVLPMMAFAQNLPGDPGSVNIGSESALFGLIYRILGLIRTLFWIVAVFMILFAAFNYLTAGGDTKKVETANATLKYAVIAIIVALVATSLPFLVKSLLGG